MGMASALLLAQQGIPSTVLERRTTPSCGQSRALAIQRDILAMFDRLGVADEMLRDGASWSVGRTYLEDREILHLEWPACGDEIYPAFVNFPQFRTEELLYAAARETGLVDFRHGRQVRRVDQDRTAVVVEAEGPDGSERYSGEHLIAADGIGSTVRKALGISFDGWQTEGRFLVADFEVDLPLTVERRLWFNPPFYPDGIVLMHCMGGGKWRIDWQIDSNFDEESELRLERMTGRVRKVIGDLPFTVLRANTYIFQQRRARKFRDGSIFLVGDAAHVVSPFGGRGMNSGLEDAENLAWKLGMVIKGQASPALLDTYEQERMATSAHHDEVTGNSVKFMIPFTAEGLVARDEVLHAAAADPSQAARIDSGQLYSPCPYTDSPLSVELDDGGVASAVDATADDPVSPGRLAPDGWCRRGEAEERTTLRKVLGGQVSLLVVPGAGTDAQTLAKRLTEALPANTRAYLLTSAENPVLSHDAECLFDESGALTGLYSGEPDRAYLVRPDCYLAVRMHLPPAGDLAPILARARAVVV
ncbi:FAD-dependent oxidoreductase [Microtetraspora sp. NBRC 16547]|nr:FAD-dependent oxidoreductase [Microtetraspora sp. NBRC 16547]